MTNIARNFKQDNLEGKGAPIFLLWRDRRIGIHWVLLPYYRKLMLYEINAKSKNSR